MTYLKNTIGNKAHNLRVIDSIYSEPGTRPFTIPSFTTVTSDDFKEFRNTWRTDRKEESQKLYAIRSSSQNEDTDSHSNAGKFDTFLGVKHNDVANKVESLISQGVPAIVQEMIVGEVSGVCLIGTSDRDTMSLSMANGLCEGIVSGHITPAIFGFKGCETGNIQLNSLFNAFDNQKKKSVLKEDVVTHIDTDEPYLFDESDVQYIAKTMLEISNNFGAESDIEFTIKDGELYLLQIRPLNHASKAEYSPSPF